MARPAPSTGVASVVTPTVEGVSDGACPAACAEQTLLRGLAPGRGKLCARLARGLPDDRPHRGRDAAPPPVVELLRRDAERLGGVLLQFVPLHEQIEDVGVVHGPRGYSQRFVCQHCVYQSVSLFC